MTAPASRGSQFGEGKHMETNKHSRVPGGGDSTRSTCRPSLELAVRHKRSGRRMKGMSRTRLSAAPGAEKRELRGQTQPASLRGAHAPPAAEGRPRDRSLACLAVSPSLFSQAIGKVKYRCIRGSNYNTFGWGYEQILDLRSPVCPCDCLRRVISISFNSSSLQLLAIITTYKESTESLINGLKSSYETHGLY